MKKIIALVLLCFSSISIADTSDEILNTVKVNLEHTQNENLEGVMATMHTQSPSYLLTKQMMEQLFPAYDLNFEILNFNFLASDTEYAYARVLMRTTKIEGPAFQNNELDVIQVFKQENGHWKLWTQTNLSIKYI